MYYGNICPHPAPMVAMYTTNSPYVTCFHGSCDERRRNNWKSLLSSRGYVGYLDMSCWMYTARCHYNAGNLLPNPQNGHSIARPWGCAMGCRLWILTLILILRRSLLWYIHISYFIGQRHNDTWLYLLSAVLNRTPVYKCHYKSNDR